MPVPGILTVWRSSRWIEKSAHEFSNASPSAGRDGAHPEVIDSAEDDEVTVNQRRMAGGQAEAVTVFVTRSGLSSHRRTVVTVIDHPCVYARTLQQPVAFTDIDLRRRWTRRSSLHNATCLVCAMGNLLHPSRRRY